MARDPFSDANAALVAALIEARKDAGLTQVQLAEGLSKPQSYVSKIERGERRVEVVEFIALARALQVEPGELLSRVAAQV
jgi:transcriptional regulator with XRE-family HTH domain